MSNGKKGKSSRKPITVNIDRLWDKPDSGAGKKDKGY